MDISTLFAQLQGKCLQLLNQPQPLDRNLRSICRLLQENVPHYDWVGIYWALYGESPELVLGPYAGAPTEHTRIAFGQGICGQAAERQATFVVQDVAAEQNYLSCSLLVKSEIVVPILQGGKVIGELDIDSHTPAPFMEEDRGLLEWLAAEIASRTQGLPLGLQE
ncbi:MAG: GAF domain-containing protein [Bacteroidetes bacterium]|nr:GAF domain-containing protein [Bacteroidota bacterium]